MKIQGIIDIREINKGIVIEKMEASIKKNIKESNT